MIKLSILIPTIKRDEVLLEDLLADLWHQSVPYDGYVEVLIDIIEEDKIGTKRNRLLERAKGEYIAFIDADDSVSDNYIELLFDAIESGCDCASLMGIITTNGGDPQLFEHSIKYKEYKTNNRAKYENGDIRYERFPNHISCIKSKIAKLFKFPEKNHGEDTDWATLINERGLLKTEYYINDVIYYYNYITNK